MIFLDDETSILDAGKIQGVTKISSRSVDINKRDSNGCTELHISVKQNEIDNYQYTINVDYIKLIPNLETDKKLNKEFGPITNQWIKDNSMGSTDFVSDDKISKYKINHSN